MRRCGIDAVGGSAQLGQGGRRGSLGSLAGHRAYAGLQRWRRARRGLPAELESALAGNVTQIDRLADAGVDGAQIDRVRSCERTTWGTIRKMISSS